MSGILEKAIEHLQSQAKAIETLLGSSGGSTGSSGGIEGLFPSTPMDTMDVKTPPTQPSTMEVPTPPVTTTPTPPVTATPPIAPPPDPRGDFTTSTFTTLPSETLPPLDIEPQFPSLLPAEIEPSIVDPITIANEPVLQDRPTGNPVSGLGNLADLLQKGAGINPQDRFIGTDIDQGFFDSDEFKQIQGMPQTADTGYTSQYGFGSGLSSSGGRAQDRAYEEYLRRTGQEDMITSEELQTPTTRPLPSFQQNFLNEIMGGSGQQLKQPIASTLSDQQKEQMMAMINEFKNRPTAVERIPFDPSTFTTVRPTTALRPAMDAAAVRPTTALRPGVLQNLGGMNQLFSRAFAGKPV